MKARELSELIDAIYAAATEPSSWPDALRLLTRATGSEVTSFLLHDARQREGEALWQWGLTEEGQRAYAAYAPKNIYALAAAPHMRTGVLFPNAPLARAEILRSEFYNDFFKPRADVVDTMGVCLVQQDDVFGFINSVRARRKADYGPGEVEVYRLALPHLQRALSLQRRLGHLDLERAALEAVLDSIATGVVFLDERRQVLFLNAPASRILTAADGISAVRDRGVVVAGPFARRFERSLAGACGGSDLGDAAQYLFRVPRPSGQREYDVLVCRLGMRRPLLSGRRAVAAVLITDPEQGVRSPEVFAGLYGLTRAETAMAEMLATDHSVEESAALLGVTLNTARWTLKQLLAKTATRRQASLVRLLVTSLRTPPSRS